MGRRGAAFRALVARVRLLYVAGCFVFGGGILCLPPSLPPLLPSRRCAAFFFFFSSMKFLLDGLWVYFPYPYLYPEQYTYMLELKRALDARGHACLEMPTGTGKTITLLALITSYQLAHPEVGKLVYASRTVPEMEKVLAELKGLVEYREKVMAEEQKESRGEILALGLSSRKNMCIHPAAMEGADRESVDSLCRKMTASWVRSAAVDANHDPLA